MSKFPNYYRSYDEIIEEMKEVASLGIREIYMGDRSFGLPLMNVMKLLQGMIDQRFNFSWSTYFHPNQYTPELLQKMKESGCHTIIVGIENSDQSTLKAMVGMLGRINSMLLSSTLKNLKLIFAETL